MGIGSSLLSFFRSLLYPLSRIPGLGFLYDVDRHVSMGSSIAGSVKGLKDDIKDSKKDSKDKRDDS